MQVMYLDLAVEGNEKLVVLRMNVLVNLHYSQISHTEVDPHCFVVGGGYEV